MTWTSPMTAVSNQAFSAAQFNQQVRDNFLLLAPAKAGTAGGYMVAQGQNSIVERTIQTDTIATSETTTAGGSTYVDLNTPGPTVTVTCRSALVMLMANIQINAADSFCGMSVAISGVSNVPADPKCGIWLDGMSASGNPNIFSSAHWFSPINRGSNTFTAKYVSNGTATATFANRTIIVMPF